MIKYRDIEWALYHQVLIPEVPPHRTVNISVEEARSLQRDSRAYFVRWTSNWDCGRETEFWYVIKDGSSSLEELSGNTRSKVRRGLKHCKVKKVDAQYLAANAYGVYAKAFERYEDYKRPVEKAVFQRQMSELEYGKAWEFWGVWNRDDELIAYSQNRIQESVCNYATVKFDPQHLRLYPSYALFFEMNKHYLNDRNVDYVNDGARALSHDTKIQSFLIQKFKFRKSFCILHVVYRADIKFLVDILFPIRRVFYNTKFSFAAKLAVLLRHEEIRRSPLNNLT